MTKITLVLMALTLAACEEAVAPVRQAAYEFQHNQTGLVFRWAPERLPVRYWVAPNAGIVAEFAQEGLGVWGHQFLYGEYRGIIVSDSTDADVLVRVAPGTPPAGTVNDDPPVIGACDGVTGFDLFDNTLTGPLRITVGWDVRYADQDVVNCLERVTVHEIGHTIGLFGHSTSEFDLMHPNPRVRAPSTEDRVTAEVLYGTPPTMYPAGDS